MSKAKIFSNLHRKLSWLAVAGILIWCISGVMHPIMSWYGPSAVTFFPPAVKLDVAQARNLLSNFDIDKSGKSYNVVKIVPAEVGPVLQLSSDATQSRDYVTLDREYYSDDKQARWLAGHYTGKADSEIRTVEKLTEFGEGYPSVNRLLPVYKINYDSPDNLVVYIHTETLALASISNDWKNSVRSIFQVLHTFSWLGSIELARIFLVAMMMITLLVFSYSGLRLIFLFKPRKIKQASRNIHRKLAYFIWLPLLLWSFSGFYHLLQSSFTKTENDVRINQAIQMGAGISNDFSWLNGLKQNILAVAMVEYNDQLYYRVALELDVGKVEPSRQARFRGRTKVGRIVYVSAESGKVNVDINDAALARYTLMKKVTGLNPDALTVEMVNRFGPGYDFRNKRLPVFKLSAHDKLGSEYFFDPSSGLLIDQTARIYRMERYSFTFLHKWNFLRPLTGAPTRDALIVLTILLILISAVVGVKMNLSRRVRI